MKARLLFCIALFRVFFFSSSTAQNLKAEEVYAKINDAVVTIYTYDENNKMLSQGSGVVLNNKGWVVTNYHVFAGADKLVVKHKDKIVEYTNIVGLNVEKDILILKIKDNTFPSIQIGNSDSLKVGEKIYAIGSPMGFENSMTEGIISGLRHFEKEKKNFIQISAAISPGSSGGAVVNKYGKLIAISTMTIKESQNLNFAIPVNDILKVYNKEGVKQYQVDAAVFFYRATYEDEKHNYTAAIENYEKAAALNPNAYVYNSMGCSYGDKGDPETAIKYFKKAIEITPEFADPYGNIGVTYNRKGDFESAIIYLKKAVEIDPQHYEAYGGLGSAYNAKGDMDSAIFYCKKAIEVNPEFVEGYLGLGIVYLTKKDMEKSIIYLKKAIDIDPESTRAYNVLGRTYSEKGDFENAIFYLKKAISIDPKNSQAYCDLGITYRNNNDFENAIYYLKKAISINPIDTWSYNALGITYRKMGDEYNAQYYFEKADKIKQSLKK